MISKPYIRNTFVISDILWCMCLRNWFLTVDFTDTPSWDVNKLNFECFAGRIRVGRHFAHLLTGDFAKHVGPNIEFPFNEFQYKRVA